MAKIEIFFQKKKKSSYSANLTVIIHNRKLLIRLKIGKTDVQRKRLQMFSLCSGSE